MSYRINTEEYYQRFIELQGKLRKSEEERLKLEIRLNKMMQIIQTEEQRHYDNLSLQYKQFCEEDKKRQDRNNYILHILDRVENQSEALEEKARRLSIIRDQYYGMPRRHYEDTRPSYFNHQFYDNESCNLSPERDMVSALADMKEYNMHKNYNLQHQEKMEYLNKYLENIDSDRSEVKSPRNFGSSKPPPYNKNSNPKTDDLRPTTADLGYNSDNFLTSRYSYRHFSEDDQSITSSPNESPRFAASVRSRSKSPKVTPQIETDGMDRNMNTDFYSNFDNTRYSRYPRRINRRKRIPKKTFSTDYKHSLQKLQRMQENSREILSRHIPKPNYYRNHYTNYDRKAIPPYQNDLVLNYPVASDFGLNINEMYQPDKVIQKYLIEKYNTISPDRYLGYSPTPFDSYQDKMMYDNSPSRPYHRYDYIRNLPDRYEFRSNIPNDYYMYPRSPRTYNGAHLTTRDIPTLNKLDDNSKLSKSKNSAETDNGRHKYADLRRDEKIQGIHFNDNDQILEYDRNRPSSEYNKKYELSKNCKEDVSSKQEVKYDLINGHEQSRTLKGIEDNDKDENTSLSATSPLIDGITFKMDGIITPTSDYSDNAEVKITRPSKLREISSPPISMKHAPNSLLVNTSSVEQPTVSTDVKADGYEKIKDEVNPGKDSKLSEEYLHVALGDGDKYVKANDHIIPQKENSDFTTDNANNTDGKVASEGPEAIKEEVIQTFSNGNHRKDIANSEDIRKENKEPLYQDSNLTEGEFVDSQLYDASGAQPEYDQSGQPIQYEENGQPIQYDKNGQPTQFDQNIEHIQYDENGQPIQCDQNGQPIQYDENGQPIQYDENGLPIQYDESGQPIQYDQTGQQLQYDQTGQLIQYDELGQPIQYDEHGQLIQYDENGQYVQNGQPIEYDQNGQPTQYDENGLAIQHDVNGQPVQYDENGQAIKYDQNDPQIQYDQNHQPIQYDENGQPLQYDEPVQYDQSGQQVQYDSNGQLVQYDETGQPIAYTEESYNPENNYEQVEGAPEASQSATDPQADSANKANVFEMLDTDTESIKQDTKVSNDSDFELTT